IQHTGARPRTIESMKGKIVSVKFGARAHDKFVADQDDRGATVAGRPDRGLDGDFRADAVGIADGECNRRRTHSGNAISVSIRELSQITIRSCKSALPPSIL